MRRLRLRAVEAGTELELEAPPGSRLWWRIGSGPQASEVRWGEPRTGAALTGARVELRLDSCPVS